MGVGGVGEGAQTESISYHLVPRGRELEAGASLFLVFPVAHLGVHRPVESFDYRAIDVYFKLSHTPNWPSFKLFTSSVKVSELVTPGCAGDNIGSVPWEN